MPTFGNSSLRRLATVHMVLQELNHRVIRYYNVTVLVGHRNEQEQGIAFNTGASTKKWPDSKHNTFPSMAIDVAPWPIPEGWGDTKSASPHARDLEWKERVKFYEMIAVYRYEWARMCEEAPELARKYKLRFGADWDGDNDYRDQDFDDLPHIELVKVPQ